MVESEGIQELPSFQNYQSFINSQEQGNNEGKKYKLRLKFDGTCLLEMVRLNGGHFQNLTHLDISGNSAEKLDLRNLSRLEWLSCANNQLEILILSGTSLTYLDCSHNNLESIVVDPLPNNLATLELSFNNLRELPSWTWMIPELFLIYASHNRIHHVDCKWQNCLSHLPIRELHLHSNKIEFISKDFIQRATRLKVLNLSQNLLESLPSFGRKCPLQELFLSRNQLQDMEDKEALEFLYECPTIKRLYLSFNKIEKVNEKFTTVWRNLEELILCGNKIQTLPSKMSLLSNLRVLRVHSNRLESVPNLTKMPHLKLLDLSHNNLKKFNLENLIAGGNLSYLDISCNDRLTLHPEQITNPKRRMNLVEVTNPRKPQIVDLKNNQGQDFPANPPWELGFAELPDRKQSLTVTQYRDINLNNGKEALFGLFDGGTQFQIPKSISKSIAKLYAEERNIEESLKLSLKYTLLNSLRNLQNGNSVPTQGILCLLSMQDQLEGKPSFTLNVAMVGDIRCILVESGKKVTRLTHGQNEDPKSTSSPSPSTELDHHDILSTKCNNDGDLSLSVLKSTKENGTMNSRSDISIPDPSVVSLPLSTSSEFLLIANASVWNYVTEDEIVDELETHRNKKSVLIAKRIADLAQSHSCKQSLSVLLVRFKWKSSSSRGLIVDSKKLSEYGPLSYYSGSSDYSDDITNPLASVTTPDSAIETDRSSGGSLGTGSESKGNRGTKSQVRSDDSVSLANTTMSVEQFRCWEYMLEQNTRLLFKKELDTISKGVFQRNQKFRKSVHFPYTQEVGTGTPPTVTLTTSSPSGLKPSSPSEPKTQLMDSTNPGFYTLSKARSLSQLLAQDQVKTNNPGGLITNPKPKSHFPLFTNANAGFLESVRATKHSRGTILGGQNAAYFGSSQRLGPPPVPSSLLNQQQKQPRYFKSTDEMSEVNSFDPMERETRLKKYWDNKITEL